MIMERVDDAWNFIRFNRLSNLLKKLLVCSWKGHDFYKPYCFRCWKFWPYELWESESE
jgi:hypothetical protein